MVGAAALRKSSFRNHKSCFMVRVEVPFERIHRSTRLQLSEKYDRRCEVAWVFFSQGVNVCIDEVCGNVEVSEINIGGTRLP